MIKKILGWFLVVAGVIQLFTAFMMLSEDVSQVGGQSAGGKFIFSIGLIGLGIWLIKSSTKKNDGNLPSKS